MLFTRTVLRCIAIGNCQIRTSGGSFNLFNIRRSEMLASINLFNSNHVIVTHNVCRCTPNSQILNPHSVLNYLCVEGVHFNFLIYMLKICS